MTLQIPEIDSSKPSVVVLDPLLEMPKGATHFNSNGTLFPFEKHIGLDVYLWANGEWGLTNAPTCAKPIDSN